MTYNAYRWRVCLGIRVSVECDAMFSGSCYIVETEQLTWADARARCVALGGHLAIIESHAENQFITDLTAGMCGIKFKRHDESD